MRRKTRAQETASGMKRCPFCAGRITLDREIGRLLFLCGACGAVVWFKNLKYPLKTQADDPVLAWNRRA